MLQNINSPISREQCEKEVYSPIPEVRRNALTQIYKHGFTNGLLTGLGIFGLFLLIANWK